ncbi:hypothetical protein [Ensifer sp. LBL]|uniref:hypothetical protein n=1 Tax=Ensifer sp. LBL TaxID=2991056 RepID=UPI003D1EB10C
MVDNRYASPDTIAQSSIDTLRLHSEITRLSTELMTARALLASDRDARRELELVRKSLMEAKYNLRTTGSFQETFGADLASAAVILQHADTSVADRPSSSNGTGGFPRRCLEIRPYDISVGLRLGCHLVKTGLRQGLFVVNSEFEFKPEYNQRAVAMAKEAATAGYFVIFVVSEREREPESTHRGRMFGGSVLEIGRIDLDFLEQVVREAAVEAEGVYLLTRPSSEFVDFIPLAQSLGLKAIYDIIDDWEELNEVGQAAWWHEDIELRAIQSSDRVVAVSDVLIAKFSRLRPDIVCVPNGLGTINYREHFVSNRNQSQNGKVVVGYFGHLTDEWFDWPGVIELATCHPNIELQIAGYGEPGWVLERCRDLPNLKLIGIIPGDRRAEVAASWHLAIIPFVDGPRIRAVDPVAIYEYLYFGLPVIASGIPHLAAYPETVVLERFRDSAKLISQIYQRLCAGVVDYRAMARFTSSAMWHERFAALMVDGEDVCDGGH